MTSGNTSIMGANNGIDANMRSAYVDARRQNKIEIEAETKLDRSTSGGIGMVRRHKHLIKM